MATLEHRGNSVRVNWRLGGSRDGSRQSCTFSGLPSARLRLAEGAKALIEARSHNITRAEVYAAITGDEIVRDDGVPTLRAWVMMWLDERAQTRDIQPDTIKNYRWVLNARAIPRLGHLQLTEIDGEVIRDWVAWMSTRRSTRGNRNRNTSANQPLSATTIGRAYRILHACLGAAVPRFLPSNPCALPAGARRHAHGLPRQEKFEGMFLRPHEIDLIVSNCDPRVRDLVVIALATGMRLGELIALQVQHITTSGAQVVVQVRQSLKDDGTVGPPKSAASRRSIPVAEGPGRLLLDLIAGKRPKDLVFPSPRGGFWTPDNLRKQYWWPAVAAAQRCLEHPPPLRVYGGRGRRPKPGAYDVSDCPCPTRLHLRPRIHDLRHSHASALINAGLSPKKVQARLGHSSYLITMNTYAHLWDLGGVEELEAVDRLLGGQ
ncbi:MAG: tyrosine-type recombinase/integrase [Actinoplanes sp.]